MYNIAQLIPLHIYRRSCILYRGFSCLGIWYRRPPVFFFPTLGLVSVYSIPVASAVAGRDEVPVGQGVQGGSSLGDEGGARGGECGRVFLTFCVLSLPLVVPFTRHPLICQTSKRVPWHCRL